MLKRALLSLSLLAAGPSLAHAAGMTIISPDIAPNAKMAASTHILLIVLLVLYIS